MFYNSTFRYRNNHARVKYDCNNKCDRCHDKNLLHGFCMYSSHKTNINLIS